MLQQDSGELSWSNPTCTGDVPSKRSGHSFTIVGTCAYLFGGMDETVPPGPTNDLYLLKMAAGEFEWIKPQTFGTPPPARWKHSATLYDDTWLVIFGGFHSSTNRFNDVWLFDTTTLTWSQPIENQCDFTPRGNHVPVANAWPGVPSPRGAHSASLVGKVLYIFGGYGGAGYSRRDFNELHGLNMEEMVWQRLQTRGKAPEPRSGHSACVVNTQIYVFGGWNSIQQFNDIQILDTETLTWSSTESGWGNPRWNHAACSVEAIPHWKMFVFGGCSGNLQEMGRTQGVYLNDVTVLDTGSSYWSTPDVKGTPPKARGDTELAYDSKGSRLLMFGGWANRWFDDVHVLDVGCVVGPPYAIMGISPGMGPVTGGQRIQISGIDFVNTPAVVVRFASRKGVEDMPGTYVSDTEIYCDTPNFSNFGPGEVDVRVALRGDSFTTTFQKYTFFAITDSSKCLAYGPGLLDGCSASSSTVFIIQAKDTSNKDRVTGGDEFTVTIKNDDGINVPVDIQDSGNGVYTCTYSVPSAGEYSINVVFEGTFNGNAGPLRGFPLNVTFEAGVTKERNKMEGSIVSEWVRKELTGLTMFTKNTSAGLATKVPEDNLALLLKVKEHLHNINEQREDINITVERTRAQLLHLESLGGTVARQLQQLEEACKLWETVQKQAPATKNAIQPLVKAQGNKTRAQIVEYEASVVQMREDFKKHVFWEFSTGPVAALEALDDAEHDHDEEKKVCGSKKHVAVMFESAELMEESEKLMAEIDNDIVWLRQLWGVSAKCLAFFESSRATLWSAVDAEEMEEEAKALLKKVKALPKGVRWCNAYKGIEQRVKDFLATCPLIVQLSDKALRPRHWVALMQVTGKNFTPPYQNPDLLLGGLLELDLHEFGENVGAIADQAQKEGKMEDILATLESTWNDVQFLTDAFTCHDDAETEVLQLRISEEDFEGLENDQLTVQGMMGSRFLATFETEVTGWQMKLRTVSDVLTILSEIQRVWSYLEPLFMGSPEVKRELPEDASRFTSIDVDVKKILEEGNDAPDVLTACLASGLLPRLEKMQQELDLCKKSLADFLDGKRRLFPRFYFVSEADLLDILSNGSNPERILKHVTKVFLATKTLVLEGEQDNLRAVRWISGVGVEEVDFEPKPVPMKGKVEVYLQVILDAMKSALGRHVERSLRKYPTCARLEWLMDKTDPTPTQIQLLVSAIQYVNEVENVFRGLKDGNSQALEQYNRKQMQQLEDLIKLTQTSLDKADRQRVMCMITMDAHSRDIIQGFMREDVSEASAFQWQSQLRQVYDPQQGGAKVRICDASFDYGFEYLGNGSRLVVTPLTDRIYVTATQALHLKMGCAPAGPAGTGKTESTKDLASALGKVCYVVNCSPEMDYQSMGNIFKGLAASGSWGCFDEFNRLVPEVLSVCSVQFKAVCDAIRANASTVTVESDEVMLDASCGAFITMNPGYLGRSSLPEGLKALFRPMTVMVPDLVLICENMLMAEGFVAAKTLARKFYGLYSLLRELLSKQAHYDWGLRAVKSVLVVAGTFKRAEPDVSEDAVLMRALRDFNTPKIVQEDHVVFFGLLGDLFPGCNPPRKVDDVLEESVTEACAQRSMWPDDTFKLKVVQLEELLAIRHCVFVMGPPGAGKSECWKTLASSKAIRGMPAKVADLNPKSVSPEELYGYITLATREWKDGLLSKVMRSLGEEENLNPKWIVLDGDLDANWIESMNSVMDDNKMLTLASNERIPLKSHMRMLFEIRDLKFATPATVSRAGILYISADDGSQWRSLIGSWVNSLPKEKASPAAKEAISGLFATYAAPALNWLKKEAKPLVPLQEITLVQSLLYMLGSMLTPHNTGGGNAGAVTKNLEPTFVFCAVWAFGSALSEKDGEDHRKLFSDFWKDTFKRVKFPTRETVFDYWLDPSGSTFDLWKNSPYFFSINYDSATTPMANVTVPTPETASVSHWLNKLVNNRNAVMLVGNAGCGKTQLVNGLLDSLDKASYVSATINFNFYTSSTLLQNTLEGRLEKKTGTNFGPPGNCNMVYFLDDLNLPEVDPYNTQSAIALVRQHMDYGHWYDRNKLVAKHIMKCQYIAAMNHTAGSFSVNPRLQRHFTTFAIGFPGPTSLLTIYQTFLDGHLKTFNADIRNLSSHLINAALSLHAGVSSLFRKTAKNFHYEFNIRHLSNVFQGLLMAQPAEFTDPAKFVQLWLHESERVYGDRLVCAADLAKYKAESLTQSKRRFPNYNMGKFFTSENSDPLVFCHFAEGEASESDKVYDQVNSLDKLRTTLQAALAEYNESNPVMNLVLFEDAVKHISRIVRIVLNPAGHALLVGVGGSGKQSLSRLAAFICNYTVKQIAISSTYGIADFKGDLMTMYRKAGTRDEGILFLFTDAQIVNERFLVFMNDLLASGDIPDLFPVEDQDAIVNSVMHKCKASGIANPDRNDCWNFFINEVRRNLHVCLCFSPVGGNMRSRSLKFPALINCTVIDWFQPWPKEALLSVAKRILAPIELGSPEIREGVENFMPFSFEIVNDASKQFFKSDMRHVHTTPKSFLELLKLFNSLLEVKRTEAEAGITRLQNGLFKLRSTAEVVGKLEEELKDSLVEAEEKKRIAEGIAETVEAEKSVVESENAKAQVEAESCQQIQLEVSEIAASSEEDLAKALPLVDAALSALNTLNKKDLGECRQMNTPPTGVDDIFSACMVLLAGVHPDIPVTKTGKVKSRTWDDAKKCLLKNVPQFLEMLKSFIKVVDEFTVPAINWREVRPYLALDHFNPETIGQKNKAASGLCSWVLNIVTYHDTIVEVEPKKLKLATARERLASATKKLEEVNQYVSDLKAKLAKLQEEFDAANAAKQAAQDAVANGQRKMDLAQRLTSALASENVRWAESIEVLEADRDLLVGDVLLASAFISYIGPFTKNYRDDLINNKWVPFMKANGGEGGIPMSENANPLNIITKEVEVARWNSQTLPSDTVSTENGAIVCSSARWPLMIDPQLQGVRWVKEMEKERGLLCARLGHKDLMQKLQEAMSNGLPLLIENLPETIDATLNPVIRRETTRKGGRLYIMLGESEVEMRPEFRLYLHTKLSNPHFPPELQAEATLVNFTVTEQGLEEQLLGAVVRKERPDLAQKRSKLIQQQNHFKIKVKDLEDSILERLAKADGDITDDVQLIEGLEDTKKIATDIAEKMVVAKKTQDQIAFISEKYRTVAARGALLFFLMNGLYKVHSYYKYSLNAFVVIFLRGIDLLHEKKGMDPSAAGAPKKKNLMARFKAAARKAVATTRFTWNMDLLGEMDPNHDNLDDADHGEIMESTMSDEELQVHCGELVVSITSVVFNYIRRGLFDSHKLTVAVQLAMSVQLRNGDLDAARAEALVSGRSALDPGSMGVLADWMPEATWARVKALETLPGFEGLGDEMTQLSEDWLRWFDLEKPEDAKVPAPPTFGAEPNPEPSMFHKMLLLRALRPDRLVFLLTKYVEETLGKEYVTDPHFDMRKAYEESSPSTPIFFVLFPGVDPTRWVENLGNKFGMTQEGGKFLNISMGQGQDKPAEAAIAKFAAEGGWIMLQNVHLMQSWLPRLERSLELASESAHADFRCYISAEAPPMPHIETIPESLLQCCIKVMNEAPADLKSNLRRAWANFDQQQLDACSKPREFKGCLFTLCFFHALVLGRRKFGQQGWSRAYSFNTGDLTICGDVCKSYIDNNSEVPWEDLRYIMGEIMYGGHITDPWDRRTNRTYLQVLLQPALFDGMELAPGYASPSPDSNDFASYAEYIEEKLPQEAPSLFRLHPNAEIGYLSTTADELLNTVWRLQGTAGQSGAEEGTAGSGVSNTMTSLLERLPANFDMISIQERAEPLLKGESGPFVVVAVQECGRMNVLLECIRNTLLELQKGLGGQLNMSDSMEDLSEALALNEVPGRNPFHRCSWEKLAWWSKKSLLPWFADLLLRVEQLEKWTEAMVAPKSLWLPGLFNPTAFLTAIMQVTSRKRELPLDNMTIESHISAFNKPEDVANVVAEDGAFVHGLFIEGARWQVEEDEDAVDVTGVPCTGQLGDSRLKELIPPLPIVYVKAVPVQPHWEPSSVGYLRHEEGIYECPVYMTTFRGPTYVFLATLKTQQPVHKWILGGVAIIMQEDD